MWPAMHNTHYRTDARPPATNHSEAREPRRQSCLIRRRRRSQHTLISCNSTQPFFLVRPLPTPLPLLRAHFVRTPRRAQHLAPPPMPPTAPPTPAASSQHLERTRGPRLDSSSRQRSSQLQNAPITAFEVAVQKLFFPRARGQWQPPPPWPPQPWPPPPPPYDAGRRWRDSQTVAEAASVARSQQQPPLQHMPPPAAAAAAAGTPDTVQPASRPRGDAWLPRGSDRLSSPIDTAARLIPSIRPERERARKGRARDPAPTQAEKGYPSLGTVRFALPTILTSCDNPEDPNA